MSLRKKLTRKPWLADPNAFDEVDGTGVDGPTARIALTFFLAVVTVLFFLLSVAYNMRMDMPDWQALSEPKLLWLNTLLLISSSVAFEWSRSQGRKGQTAAVKLGLYVAGGLTFGFLIGQFVVWRQLAGAGLYAETNPSYAFFYLITALHGLHLLGGLIAWARTTAKAAKGEAVEKVTEGVGLCAIYWHFLLAVWILMFALLLYT